MILKPTDFKNDEILVSSFSPGGFSLYPDQDVLSATLAPTIIVQSGLGDYDIPICKRSFRAILQNFRHILMSFGKG